MKISYYAIFDYDETEPEFKIGVKFPGIPGAYTCARNEEEAVKYSREVLGLMLFDDDNRDWIPKEELPKFTPLEEIKLNKNEKAVLIDFDTNSVDLD